MTTNPTTAGKTAKVIATLIVACGLLFSSCKKDPGPKGDTGPAGPQGPAGPTAKYYDFTLTFGTSTTIQTYNMPSGSMYGKVTFVYLDTGFKDWVLLPYFENKPGFVPVNYVAICDEVLEKINCRTDRGDNQTGSPWAVNNVQKDYRAVVISASAGKSTNPGIDFTNYKEVKEFYNLPD